MSDDDLGKRVTKFPGFRWRVGMASKFLGKDGFIESDPGLMALWNALGAPRDVELDLEHFANTGFLLDLLSSIHDDAYANCVEVGFLSDEGGEYRELVAYEDGETVNHALARAILAAVERAT